MTDNNAFLQDALPIQLIGAGLADHLPDGGLGHLRVIRRPGVFLRPFPVGVFEVRQIDVDFPLQGSQGLHLVIPPAVPDHRHRQGLLQRLGHCVGVVGGVHQVNVVGPGVDQLEENFPQAGEGDFFSEVLLADAVVLAENAAQGAAGKEHGARPPGAGEGRFLPLVESRPGQHRRFWHPAAAAALGAVTAALAGTEGTTDGIKVQVHDSSSSTRF